LRLIKSKKRVKRMKNQTVLECPNISEMNSIGFQRMGMIEKKRLNEVIENSIPWRQWFFCPLWKNDVEAWYKD
jgi:hypothetical protein